jgi:hypothetical protein
VYRCYDGSPGGGRGSVGKLMEARMGQGFVCRGKPWLLLDRKGDDSNGTILNEMCD